MAAVLETRATNGDAEAMLALAKMHARALEAGPSSRASSDSQQEARTLAMRWLGAHVRALGLGGEAAKLAQKLGLFWTPRGSGVLPWRSKPFAALTFTETQRYLPALCAILNKPCWWDKLRDGEIVARWRAEGTRPHRPGYDDSDYFRDFVPTEEETTKKKKKKKGTKTSVTGEALNCELDPGVTADQVVYHDPEAPPPMKDPELFKLSAAEFEFMLQELRYVAENELVRPSFATQSVSGNASDEASVVITPITSPGVYISDSAIPDSMREELVHSLEPLEQFARQAGRWHPGSDHKVLDLLHPSQSCAVSGRTTFSFTPNTVAGEYRYSWPAPPARTSLGILDGPTQSSGTTQWIPSDVLVQKDGTVSFESRINGLGASAHRSLVPILSAILSRAVPLLELSVGSLKQAEARGDIWQKKPASQRTRQRTVKKKVFDIAEDYTQWMGSLYLLKKYGRFPTADLLDRAQCYDDREYAIDSEPDFESVVGARVDPRYYPGARLQAEFTPPTGKDMTSVQGPPPAPRSLRDTRMQVYVKIAMIELTPEKPSYPGGKWHLEGLQVGAFLQLRLFVSCNPAHAILISQFSIYDKTERGNRGNNHILLRSRKHHVLASALPSFF
jgi:hypothetical protein